MSEDKLCPYRNECVSKPSSDCTPEFTECIVYGFYLRREEKEKAHVFDVSDLDVHKINKLPELSLRLERLI